MRTEPGAHFLRQTLARSGGLVLVVALFALLGAGPLGRVPPSSAAERDVQQQTVRIRVTEAGVEVAPTAVGPGSVIFEIRNDATVRYEVEIKGRGLELEIDVLPGSNQSATLPLSAGRYEIEAESEEGPEREWKADLHVRG